LALYEAELGEAGILVLAQFPRLADTLETVPASEFTRNFGRYRMRAQREALAVSSHGQITGYFVGPDEYEEFRRFRESRRNFVTAELPEEKVEAIGTSRMDARHSHLDKMLDPK
jgi:hypothetical protein